ncbi:hypothetical protein B4U79_17036, partial [Dinothrombium tinctorium]
MLRYLVSMKILDENENIFSVTRCGSLLVTNNWVKCGSLLSELTFEGAKHFGHTLETGESAFEHEFGMSYFDYLHTRAEYGDLFWKMLRGLSNSSDIIAAYDFSRFEHIVDVGGGEGKLLIEILKKATHSRGTLFETPMIAEKAEAAIAEKGLSARCKAVAGNFFDSVPIDGDCYILKFVLHDWSDEKCLKILRNIRTNMKEKSKLVIIEGISEDDFTQMYDFSLWVTVDGKERNLSAFKELLNKV